MGTIIRFIVSAPVAAVITVLIFLFIYNQLSPRPFLYTTPEQPGNVYVQLAAAEPGLICIDCGDWFWLPEKPSTSNPWSSSEKAVKEAPRLSPQRPATRIEITPFSSDGARPCDGSGGDIRLLLHRISPPYPEACLRKNAEGTVIVQYDITKEGYAANVVILETPDDCFNRAVISIVRKYRFRPLCRSDGTPVGRTNVKEAINFKLVD